MQKGVAEQSFSFRCGQVAGQGAVPEKKGSGTTLLVFHSRSSPQDPPDTQKCAVITGGSQANQDVNSALLSYTFFLLIRFLKLSSLINMHFTSDSGSDTRLNSSNCVYLLVHLTVLC